MEVSNEKNLFEHISACEQRIEYLEKRLGSTWIINEKFWKRAFGIWGHALSAYLVVIAGFFAIGVFFGIIAAIAEAIAG